MIFDEKSAPGLSLCSLGLSHSSTRRSCATNGKHSPESRAADFPSAQTQPPGQRESGRPRWLHVHAPTRTQVSATLTTSVSLLANRRAHVLRRQTGRELCDVALSKQSSVAGAEQRLEGAGQHRGGAVLHDRPTRVLTA